MSSYLVIVGDIGTIIFFSRNNGKVFLAVSLLLITTHAVRSNLLNLLFHTGWDTTIRSGGRTIIGK